MRKHNRKMTTRWPRDNGDRSNTPQQMSHVLANSKGFQLAANSLLRGLIARG